MKASEFLDRIDATCLSEKSILLRYRKLLIPILCDDFGITLDEEALVATSANEGARISAVTTYKGVQIQLLDETSQMTSGTFKSLVACLSISLCRMAGVSIVVFESGANTGTALSKYAAAAGLFSLFVTLPENLRLLSARMFNGSRNWIVAAAGAQTLKGVARAFAERLGAQKIPELEWRYAAGMFRGCRIAEQILGGTRIDWISQTVSAGFGPIGIFRMLSRLDSDLPCRPKLLAVQQAENSPYFDRITGQPAPSTTAQEDLLIPAMYDRAPFTYGAYEDFAPLIRSGGEILTVGKNEFAGFLSRRFGEVDIIELLNGAGTQIRVEDGAICDPTGLVGLAGVIKAVDRGVIRPGETVLHALTSGACPKGAPPEADAMIRTEEDFEKWVAEATSRFETSR